VKELPVKTFMIKGVHNSGKTTLVAGVIRELKTRGYTVGTIKDIHAQDFHMDRPGADTNLHAESGASLVVARGLTETDVMFQYKLQFSQMLPLFTQDFLILEGDPGVNCPNMVTGHDEIDLDQRCDSHTVCFGGVVGETLAEYMDKPVFRTKTQIKEITDLIEEKAMETKTKGEDRELKLYFDGEEVLMVPFVESIIRATILGIVGELKGFEETTKVTIEL
jgi:molybdopterin-guanine dinucleotide biosynthesis adapter protein